MSEQKPVVEGSKMDKLVALCRRKGFIFQSSEIYGGINGFWDYGPLGVELKRNLKDAWWHDIVRCPGVGADGQMLDMVGLDTTIITHPKVWEASGHLAGFADPMSTCRECKKLFRTDQVYVLGFRRHPMTAEDARQIGVDFDKFNSLVAEVNQLTDSAKKAAGEAEVEQFRGLLYKRSKYDLVKSVVASSESEAKEIGALSGRERKMLGDSATPDVSTMAAYRPGVYGPMPCPNPECRKENTLTEPRLFNLMFFSYTGAILDEQNKVYLRPETAQGIFVNFRNVVDTSRVKVPFGIAQQGKAFRNEVTPRNFTFRSREFEQMEIEFFIRPESAHEWYKFWRDERFKWWQSIGLASSNLQLREHDRDELAHYAKAGAGTSDIEYKFPFTDPDFGELEGVAHRTDFDLSQHAKYSGLGDKLKYFDQEMQVKLMAEGKMSKEQIAEKCKYFPHVIEPSAGADRGTLALLCEAYTDDPGRPSGVVMKFHPRMAPIKAAVLPLVDKDGMPEIAEKIYKDLRTTWNVQMDVKQSVGKRYARMDEAGTPYCFTVDSQTLTDQTVTVRHRDTLQQERIGVDHVRAFLAEKVG